MFWLNLFIRGVIFAGIIFITYRFLFEYLRHLNLLLIIKCYKFFISDVLIFTALTAILLANRTCLQEVWSCQQDLTEGFSAMMEPVRAILGRPKLPKDFHFSPIAKHTLISDGLLSNQASKIPIIMASLGSGLAILCYIYIGLASLKGSLQVLRKLRRQRKTVIFAKE